MGHHRHPPSGFHLHPQLAEDTVPVFELALCEVRLMDDANHPWLVLVPRIADVTELIDLDAAQRTLLTAEIDATSRALNSLFKPDKLNIAALGNMVPQLHVHVIARFHNDIAWPRPVWGVANARPYAPEQLVERINSLSEALRQG